MKISKEIFLCFSVILTTNILTVHGQCTFLTATSSSQYLESHSSYGSFHYSSNEDKCWIIQTSDFTKVVEIYRSGTFQLESYQSSSCSYDKLQVYDSSTTSGSSVNFCGTNIFTYLWSSGSSMYLRFKTDSSNNYDGFRIRYKQVSSSSYSSSRWSSSYYSYSSSSTNYSSTTSSFLSIGTIIGIVMGVIVFIIVIVIVCVVICVGAASSRGRRVGVVRGANTTVITQQQQMQRPVGAQPYPAPAYSTGPAPLPQPYSTGPAPPPGGPGAPPSQYPPPPPPAYTSPAYPPPSYGVNPAAGGPPPPADGPPSNYPS